MRDISNSTYDMTISALTIGFVLSIGGVSLAFPVVLALLLGWACLWCIWRVLARLCRVVARVRCARRERQKNKPKSVAPPIPLSEIAEQHRTSAKAAMAEAERDYEFDVALIKENDSLDYMESEAALTEAKQRLLKRLKDALNR